MSHDPIGGYPGRESIAVVHALSPAEIEGKRDGVGEVLRVGEGEFSLSGIAGR